MKLAFIAAAVLLTTAAPAIAEQKPTPADIGREACRIHENGIPLPRAMQIAAKSNMAASLRLSMATTTDEFVKIVHGETSRACSAAWNKHVKKIQHQQRMAAQKACANKLASVPTADRLKVLMSGC
nr:hypothetical protein [uncultured Mediterranean phage uvMED]